LDGVTGVLVLNAGSTSVKIAWFDGDVDRDDVDPTWSTTLATQDLGDGVGGAVERALNEAALPRHRIVAVGHRIVHGGARFDKPVLIDNSVEDAVEAIAELAPIHNRFGVDAIDAARKVLGASIPHVAVFDTTFHRTMPRAATTYGGPYEWVENGLRRYGFHGISHEHASRRAADILDLPLAGLRLVTCHLGGGSSLAAVAGGRSLDTTMGYTPLDGVVMATRSGSVDPGLLLHLLRTGTTVDDLDDVLERKSGLLGLSGVSADLREVMSARDGGDERCRLAVDVFVHRLRTAAGAMVASLAGVDAFVFTGGIGEHSPEVRTRVVAAFGFIGVGVDEARNNENPIDADVSTQGAVVRTLVVKAREELAVARAVRNLLL
jgi:acetate kinase